MSAFIELVLSRGYETVTAEEISRKANIGRSTFYLHYASKRELLAESMRNLSNRMAAGIDADVTPQHLMPLLDHFREQYPLNRAFFVDPIRSLWVRSLAASIQSRLTRGATAGKLRPSVPRLLVALAIAEMQIALIAHWLGGRFSLKSELVAATLIANTRALLSGMCSL
jgi:AcrR family transcriptional regulator